MVLEEAMSLLWQSKLMWTAAAMSAAFLLRHQMSKAYKVSKWQKNDLDSIASKQGFSEVRLMEFMYAALTRNNKKQQKTGTNKKTTF